MDIHNCITMDIHNWFMGILYKIKDISIIGLWVAIIVYWNNVASSTISTHNVIINIYNSIMDIHNCHRLWDIHNWIDSLQSFCDHANYKMCKQGPIATKSRWATHCLENIRSVIRMVIGNQRVCNITFITFNVELITKIASLWNSYIL